VRRSARERTRRNRGLLIAAGALVLVAAAISFAVIELVGNDKATSIASLAADSVGVIDPDTNKIVAQIPVGSTPTRIAFGNDGIWVVSKQDKTVTRIDPETRTALRTLAVGGPPVDVAVGENAVWLLVSAHTALGGRPARIVRVDPDPGVNDVVKRIPIGLGPFGFGSTGSLAAADGVVWVVNHDPRVAVSRIDAATNTETDTFTVGGPSLGFNGGTAERLAQP
jgi:YVTN family beta-propeller protein